MSELAPTEYAPPLKWHRRRRVRLACLLVLLACAAAGSRPWWAPVHRQVRLLYWQHQCLNYAGPATTVVYSVDPAQTATPTAPVPEELYWYDVCASGREDSFCGTGLPDSAPLFMHGRRTKSGSEWLVVMDCHDLLIDADGGLVGAVVRVSRPAGMHSKPELVHEGLVFLGQWRNGGSAPGLSQRWYAGHADPTDPSHFTIRYKWNDESGVIDGWLLADDRVRLAVRDGPARAAWEVTDQTSQAFR